MLHMDDKRVHLKASKTKLLSKWPLGRPSERRYTKEQTHTKGANHLTYCLSTQNIYIKLRKMFEEICFKSIITT